MVVGGPLPAVLIEFSYTILVDYSVGSVSSLTSPGKPLLDSVVLFIAVSMQHNGFIERSGRTSEEVLVVWPGG